MSHDQLPNEHDDLQLLFRQTRPRETAVDVDELVTTSPARWEQAHDAGSRRRWRFALTSATLLAAVACLLFLPDRSREGIAFAQVKEQVERVRTVDYVQTSLVMDDRPEGAIDTRLGSESPRARLTKLTETLENRLKPATVDERTEIFFRLELLKPYLDPQVKDVPDDIRRVRIKGRQLQRTDHIFPFGQFHDIRNARTGETASFDHEQKTRKLLTTQVTIDRSSGRTTERPIEIPPTVDFFHRFRAIPENATERLPGKTIDDTKVTGFRSVEEHETGTWTRTFWVDENTKLPVQIVTEFESRQEGLSSSKWIQDHFVFDRELDDALFSTKTPDGYTEKEEKVYGYE